MKIFLDTADQQEISKWVKTGILDGVTTNPTLLSKAGGNPVDGIKEIAQLLGDRDVSVEVTEKDPEKVYEQAKKIAAIANNIVVKVPCHLDYYATIKRLVDEGIALNITLVFSVAQAVAMNKLGVRYISPFIGRLDDNGQDGVLLVQELCLMRDLYNFKTQILAASIRSVEHVQAVVLSGVDVVTIPVDIMHTMLEHELTNKGMAKFLEDWKTLGVQQFP